MCGFGFFRPACLPPFCCHWPRAGSWLLCALPTLAIPACLPCFAFHSVLPFHPTLPSYAENKKDVDMIHEFLLVKGVEAVATHGGKDQEERTWAIDSFKAGQKVRRDPGLWTMPR